jgi:hypothetical protein
MAAQYPMPVGTLFLLNLGVVPVLFSAPPISAGITRFHQNSTGIYWNGTGIHWNHWNPLESLESAGMTPEFITRDSQAVPNSLNLPYLI